MRRLSRPGRFVLWLACLLPLSATLPPQRWLAGNPADATPTEPTTGGLLLMGGGGEVDDALRWFLQQAGGADIVVLRCSGSDGYNRYLYRELGVPVDSVETLLLTSRAQSYDPAVLATLAAAEAVFIAGGDQSDYVRFWQDTPLAAALNRHVAAGRPLGGTSAGLAILGGFTYSAMHESDLTAELALREPDSRLLTLTEGPLQLPFLGDLLTDSHFTERHRLGRLLVMLHRVAQRRGGVPPRGLGIDERTALAISADGRGRVFAAGTGHVHLVTLTSFAPASPDGAHATVVKLGPTSTWDLPTATVGAPVDRVEVRITGDRLQVLPAPNP